MTSLAPSVVARSSALSLFAVHDIFALVYLAVIFALVFGAHGAARSACLARIALSALVVVVAAVASRSRSPLPAWLRAHGYRAALALVVVESYLVLRDLLPLVRPDHLDATLLAADRALFGLEPALWLERFNTPGVVEWFAFFYFSYFVMCGGYIVVVLWATRDESGITTFALGSMMVMFTGHLGYLAVPGHGPIVYLADSFSGPLAGGFFWGCVRSTVDAGGAMKDIFPSLHTALPTWFSLYALHRSRRDRRWRAPAAVTAFFAANIIVSTMLLRWHYAVDVMAGFALAVGVAFLAPRVVAWERGIRSARSWPSIWA